MEQLEPNLQSLTVTCSSRQFWLQRQRGSPLLMIENLRSESDAHMAGLRNNDIVVRLNGRPVWEMTIGEALMLISGADGSDRVSIDWIAADLAALALHVVRERRRMETHQEAVSTTQAGTPHAIERHRQRNLHTNMSPEQISRHRLRNTNSAMSPEQVSHHRRRNLHDDMNDEQIAQHRQRNQHEHMNDEQIAQHRQRNQHEHMNDEQIQRHRERAAHIVMPRDGAIRLDYGTRCSYCGFRFLVGETNKDMCCGRGKATAPPFPQLTPLPFDIRRLAMNYPKHFAEQSFQYNNLLAFAIIGVDNGDPDAPGFVRPLGGPHCIKIHGRTYHRVATANRARNAVRYFVFDALDEIQQHGEARRLNDDFLQLIYRELQIINPFARELRMLGRELTMHAHPDPRIRPRGEPPTALRLTSRTHGREIGAVVMHGDDHHYDSARPSILLHLQDQDQPQYLRGDDPLREPLCYPLLFPSGDLGWGRDNTFGCEHAEYLRYRMLMPEEGLEMQTQSRQRYVVNRFQLLSRVAQVYLVDTISRIEDNRLNYIRSHQATFLGEDNDDNDDPNQPRRFFLPSSFTGSTRHLKKLAANSLALVSARGKPTIFLTLTCNPRWPEIVRELLEGQTAFDRPDITCRVFHTKLQQILKYIRQGDIFGVQHPVEYEMRVIEFQLRGLPHAHVVMRLGGLPEDDLDASARWIDQHISASVPSLTEDLTEEDRNYVELATKHMMHTCNRGENGCLNSQGMCEKRFPKPMTETTHFDERGYPIYRRTTPESGKVVPHNRLLLELWDGHVNVEFAGYVFLVLYLYKYIFKGPDKARVEVRDGGEDEQRVEDRDEITRYVRARYLSSMECMWTTLRFQTYPATTPPVKCVTVQMPDQLPPRDQVSDMLRYFHRPVELHQLRYTELFATYMVEQRLPQYAQAEGYERFERRIKGQLHHYFRRRNQDAIVCRMNTVYIMAGEVWYLRLILLNRPITSHEDARTVDGQIYRTYQEAAKAAGYATDENEARLCFLASMMDSSPPQLRGLFILLTREGYPTIHIYQQEDCMNAMMADYLEREDSRDLAINRLLQDLADRLSESFRSLRDYGLPEPQNLASELSREQLRFNAEEQRVWIDQQARPSAEQQAVLDAVVQALQGQQRLLLFVQGRGGTGKTWLMKRILAEVRAQGGLALVCAATGLAATLYEGGTTAHSLFKIPIEDEAELEDEEHELKCNLPVNSQRLELLMATDLVVWDEFPNNHRHSFEAVYHAMRGFERRILVACGDFRQIPPVVPGGDKWSVVDASVQSSPLWRNFQVMELTVSHRHASDPEYSAFVQEIGEGAVGEEMKVDDIEFTDDHGARVDRTNPTPNAKIVPLQLLQAFSSATLDDAISFVYPDLMNVVSLSDRAILAPTNDLVDEWNSRIQNKRCELAAAAEGAARSAGEIQTMRSADVLTECDDEKGHIRRMLTTEFLNSLNRPGVPPHELRLAVGDICIVMRNLNKKDGLTNNRRVAVLAIQRFAVKVQTIGAHPKVFTLPRIRFKFRLPQGSFEVMRTQFPLRLAYCMTYNKSQGQELQSVLVDLRKPAFTHGHLYVALSRVRQRESIAAFVSDEDLEDTETPFTLNIVYPELLAARPQHNETEHPRHRARLA